MWILAQEVAMDAAAIGRLLDRVEKAADKADATGMIYLFIIVIVVGAIGAFFLLRYMLSHAREIHSEANKTLLEISAKHETRCSSLTDAFTGECAQLRQVILRIMSDARDMVHATRDIAQTSVSQKELLEMYRKEEERIKNRGDRDTAL